MTDGDPGPRWTLVEERPVRTLGAIGISQAGWDKLSETFTWVTSRFSDVIDFHFDVKLVGVDRDLADSLGFERFDGSIAGHPGGARTGPRDARLPARDGCWKIVHRHAGQSRSRTPWRGHQRRRRHLQAARERATRCVIRFSPRDRSGSRLAGRSPADVHGLRERHDAGRGRGFTSARTRTRSGVSSTERCACTSKMR